MKKKYSKIAFTRKDSFSLDCLCVVKFKHSPKLQTPQEVIKAFQHGITQWVETTDEGQKVWDYTCEDLNIGDILGYNKDKALSKCLRLQGIKKWKVLYQLVPDEEVSYDMVLAKPREASNAN